MATQYPDGLSYEPNELQRKIKQLYGCNSTHLEGNGDRFGGKGIEITIYTLLLDETIPQHQGVTHAYAWLMNDDVVVKLHEGPVNSPQTALEKHLQEKFDDGVWQLMTGFPPARE